MREIRRRLGSRGGTTLVELLVAAAIMSVGILGLFGAFRYITRSIFVSRGQTLATNLAQERIEYLKNINYYALLVTTAPATDNSFVPGIEYDTSAYPPETISIAGITYTRYTHVAMARVDNDVISEVAFTYPDTGMKQITVHVLWTDNGVRKKWSLRNLLENPYVNPLDATITGTITRSGGGAVAGAVVSVEQNSDWNGVTDASGNYNFKVYHGTYSVRASSAGFYDAVSSAAAVSRGGSREFSLSLTPIATGTVAGIAWYNPDLVFSQVVANTFTFVADGAQDFVEYIELFNPTTYPIAIGDNGATYPKPINIWYYDEDSSFNRFIFYQNGGAAAYTRQVFVSTFVPSRSYYLVANSSYFLVNGQWINADAYYYENAIVDTPDVLRNDKAGGLHMYRWPSAIVPDVVGWRDNDHDPPVYEVSPIIDIGAGNDSIGTPAGKQIVRVSSPGVNMSLISTLGRAYDSGSNAHDWLYTYSGGPSFFYTPNTVASGAFPVVTGKPALGAYVSASDLNSNSTQAAAAYISSNSLQLPYAPFVLRGVSTGTWELALAYGSYSLLMSTVVVTQNAVTSVPNSVSSPAWTASGRYHVQLDSITPAGFVRGQVTNPAGQPIPNIRVQGGGNAKLTGSNGLYFMPVTSGTISLVANPNNLNGSYVQSIASVDVSSGAVATQDFTLSLGGRIQGYATSGTTPLANIVFVALLGGSQAGTGTTDATGTFNIRNISTGTYTVQPVLEVGQDTSPNNPTVVLSSTGTVFVATFTISGAFGSIAGSVSDAAGLVTSGALIIASTSTISATPPSIAGSSSPALTPYYMVSSRADGYYTMPVRGANTYYVSVYVPVISGSGVSVTTKTYSGVVVSPGGTTTRNVTIP